MFTAVAKAPYVQFLAGFVIGVLLGLLLGPLLRSWLAWREYVDASREADLTNRLLERLEEDGAEEATRPEYPSGSSPVDREWSGMVARPPRGARAFRSGKRPGGRRLR